MNAPVFPPLPAPLPKYEMLRASEVQQEMERRINQLLARVYALENP